MSTASASSTPTASESKGQVTSPVGAASNGDFHLLREVDGQILSYQHPCPTLDSKDGWKDWTSQFATLLNKRIVLVGRSKILLPSEDKRGAAELKQKYVCYNCGDLMLNPTKMTVKMDSGSTFDCGHLACEVCWQELAQGECSSCSDPDFVQDVHYNEYDIESFVYLKDEDLTTEINKLLCLCPCGDISSLGNCAKGIHHHCTMQARKGPFSKLSGLITFDKLRNIVTTHLTESWQLLNALDYLTAQGSVHQSSTSSSSSINSDKSIQAVQTSKGSQDQSQLNGCVGIRISNPSKPADELSDEDELSDADDMPDLVSVDGDELVYQPTKTSGADERSSPGVLSALSVLSSPLPVPVPIAPLTGSLERRTVIVPYPVPMPTAHLDAHLDEDSDYEGDDY